MQNESSEHVTLTSKLLSLDGLRGIPRPAPLIQGKLNLNSLAWIAGPPGSYKTFLALDTALRVAVAAPVLYVVAEGASGLADRVDAWRKSTGLDPKHIWFLPQAVPATHFGLWTELIIAAKVVGAHLIVLDTQARMSGGLDENDAKDMDRYIQAVDALRLATGACVLSVHHSSKAGSHLRGSSVVQGAADTVFAIEAKDKVVGVVNIKQKDMAQHVDQYFRIVLEGLSCVLVECEKPLDWEAGRKKTGYGTVSSAD